MSSNDRPWFKFFPRDWLSDEKVRALSFFARGVYVEILSLLWNTSSCELPADIERLSKRVGLPAEEFQKAWDEIQFPGEEILKIKRGKIRSSRLFSQKVELEAISDTRRKAAKVRWGKGLDANALQPDMQKHAITEPDTEAEAETDIEKEQNAATAADPAGSVFSNQKKSNHYSKIVGKYVAEIDAVSLEVSRRFSQKKMNPFQFAQRAANENQHPQAIIDSLRAVVEQKVKQPWAYARAVLKTKSQNYREQEFQAEAAAFKETYTAPKKLKAILATIGKEPKK